MPEQRDSRRSVWRFATPLVLAAAGTLLVTSSVSSAGTDLRPGRYENLADLANQESDRVRELRRQVRSLDREVARLSAGVDSARLAELETQTEALLAPAGLQAVHGPGLTVALQDAPEAVQDAAGEEVRNTIVHQQDIQAVANALWTGGAEAMTIQGQRVISTTGIKCVGNTVILHGVPYSPPYVVSAIGDVDTLRAGLEASPYVQGYLEAVDAYQLGWELKEEADIQAPAYDGPLEMRHASATAD
jgi:uncharacterized protein YlxW (UPF0749 family)